MHDHSGGRPRDATVEQDEEILEVGRRRRIPRWVWPATLAVVAALVVAVVASRPEPKQPAAGWPPPASTTQIVSAPVVGRPLPLASSAVALAVASSDNTTWVLQPGYITVFDGLLARRADAAFTADVTSGAPALLVDAAEGLLWVVVEGTPHGLVLEFDAFTLRRVRELSFPELTGAAVLHGHLFLTSGAELIDIPRGTAPTTTVIPQVGVAGAIAADPTRSRLLVLDYGTPTHVWTYQPDIGFALSSVELPLVKGTIAVTGGVIWVGGFGESGALLAQLDASSLTRSGGSRLTDELGPGAVIVAGGKDVFWVRSGGGGDDLWCVNSDGSPSQHWNVVGAVASTTGEAVVGAPSGVLPLRLNGCAG